MPFDVKPGADTFHDCHGQVETIHEDCQPTIGVGTPSTPINEQLENIASSYPESSDIIERWLVAKMPMEQALVLIVLELSQRLSATENAFRRGAADGAIVSSE